MHPVLGYHWWQDYHSNNYEEDYNFPMFKFFHLWCLENTAKINNSQGSQNIIMFLCFPTVIAPRFEENNNLVGRESHCKIFEIVNKQKSDLTLYRLNTIIKKLQ